MGTDSGSIEAGQVKAELRGLAHVNDDAVRLKIAQQNNRNVIGMRVLGSLGAVFIFGMLVMSLTGYSRLAMYMFFGLVVVLFAGFVLKRFRLQRRRNEELEQFRVEKRS